MPRAVTGCERDIPRGGVVHSFWERGRNVLQERRRRVHTSRKGDRGPEGMCHRWRGVYTTTVNVSFFFFLLLKVELCTTSEALHL